MRIAEIIAEAQTANQAIGNMAKNTRAMTPRLDPDARYYGGAATLNEPVPMRGTQPLDITDPDAEEQVLRNTELGQIRAIVKQNIKSLTKKEQEVILGRFWNGLTLDDIGRRMGLSKDRIRQIEAKALRKLRHPSKLGGQFGKEYMAGKQTVDQGTQYQVNPKTQPAYQHGYDDSQNGRAFDVSDYIPNDRDRELYRQGYIAGQNDDF